MSLRNEYPSVSVLHRAFGMKSCLLYILACNTFKPLNIVVQHSVLLYSWQWHV